MHRLSSLRNFYQASCQQLLTSGSNTIKINDVNTFSCSHCQNIRNHLKTDTQLFFISKRFQSTREALIHRSTRKKKKIRNHRKYVELLEVNDMAMTETKASVTKFNAKHLSKLAANVDVSLGQLHKLKSAKNPTKVVDDSIDMELLREIENSVLNKYKQVDSSGLKIDEDDSAVIFISKHMVNIQTFQEKSNMKMIKDSYDKFRRETLRDQKMKDLICAINEGVNQNMKPDDGKDNFDVISRNQFVLSESFSGNVGPSMKGAHEIFREYLSEFKQLNYDSIDIENLGHIEELEAKGITIPCIDEGICSDMSTLLHKDLSKFDTAIVNSDSKNRPVTAKVNALKLKSKSKKKNSMAIHLAKQNYEKMQKLSREYSLTQLLMAHLEMCVAVGSLDKGLQILNHYRNRGKRMSNHASLNNVKLYNILLQGFAGEGDYTNVSNILDTMRADSITMDIQSYAAVFECIQRSKMANKCSLLNGYRNEILSQGLCLNDLVDKTKFSRDQRKYLIQAIQSLEPSFVPRYTRPVMEYECSLVNHLNAKDSLATFTSPAEGLITADELMKKALKQMDNEISGTINVENIENKGEPSKTMLYCREKLTKWEEEWREVIRKVFKRNLITLKSQSTASHSALNIFPYLNVLDIEEFVELLMLELRKLADGSETYSPTVRTLQRDLGLKVFLRYQIHLKKRSGVMEKIKDLYSKYCKWYINRNEQGETEMYNSRRKWQQLLHDNRDGASVDIEEHQWPVTICVGVGRFLYNILMNDIKVDINVFKRNLKKPKYLPALYSVYRGQGYMLHQELKPHPVLVRLVRESCPPYLRLDSALVPSLCPPLPWSGHSQGGYLLTKTLIMRTTMGGTQQLQRLQEAPTHSLLPALDSLNQLGAVPWCINKPVLDVLLHVFRSGGSRELKVAQPGHAAPLPPPLSASLSRKERAIAQRARACLARQRQEMHSLWCDSLYKLSLANHFRDEIFWLPHNMDFRGRVYPCPPHLSHLGADGSRAVLMFARGKPLGPQGLDWLKLHCINLTGTMKRETVQERLVQADLVMDKILDSADRPLEGCRWWVESEKPWQTLACCIEIANASRSPNPEEYISHFPVHQDGSCNGLQHYAALGGDTAGAFSVNLAPADRPQDVYSAVVALVEASRARDAAAGVKIAQSLEGFIKRKVIKQTVMTTVYGVTRFGARLQIAKQLKDVDGFPKEHVWTASTYLTVKTFESLREMFTSTKEIQDWFTECAKLISSVCSEKVEWITPLGIPVVQPYHKLSKNVYNGKGNIMEYSSSCDQHEKPCVIKQKNAFPPNFIHSLDSTHMMLTSLHCEEKDITFVSVHDCFWTHPSTVNLMNQVCREQFVALHSQPILKNLSEHLIERYNNFASEEIFKKENGTDTSRRKLSDFFRQLPQKGDFDLRNVLGSVYFFS